MSTSTYTVERTATIATEPERVYEQVADFHHWMNWSPWEDLDPNQRRTFSGPESGVGAAYAWSGNRKAGSGHMSITHADPPSEVRIALDFEKPFKSSNTTTFLLTPEDSGTTRVTWTMTGPHSLATKIIGIFSPMDKMIGKDFEKGLTRLKRLVESGAAN